jgi:DNA repair protein RadA/Sms
MEGRRPLLAELQALVSPSALQVPRRTSHGMESSRLAMVLAVVEKRANIRMYSHDVYASTVGGARVADPAADLAIAIAIASAAINRAVPRTLIALGEVGLAGELRRVPGADRRLAEAARLGFTEAVVPAESGRERGTVSRNGMTVHRAATIAEALALLGLARQIHRPEAVDGRHPAGTRIDPARRGGSVHEEPSDVPDGGGAAVLDLHGGPRRGD